MLPHDPLRCLLREIPREPAPHVSRLDFQYPRVVKESPFQGVNRALFKGLIGAYLEVCLGGIWEVFGKDFGGIWEVF